jgi:Uma2 family endonuclease
VTTYIVNNDHAMVTTMSTARRRATYEDLLKVPETLIAEILDGELVTSPRPASPHAYATSMLTQDLGPFSRRLGGPGGPGGWWILFEPELHLRADIVVPDLAGWRRDRMPILRNVSYFEQAPDWVCETLSQSTMRVDRIRKMRIYAREQVGHVWLVDPLARTLEVYRLEGSHWVLVDTYDGEEPVHAEPFEAIALDLNRWWLEEENANRET